MRSKYLFIAIGLFYNSFVKAQKVQSYRPAIDYCTYAADPNNQSCIWYEALWQLQTGTLLTAPNSLGNGAYPVSYLAYFDTLNRRRVVKVSCREEKFIIASDEKFTKDVQRSDTLWYRGGKVNGNYYITYSEFVGSCETSNWMYIDVNVGNDDLDAALELRVNLHFDDGKQPAETGLFTIWRGVRIADNNYNTYSGAIPGQCIDPSSGEFRKTSYISVELLSHPCGIGCTGQNVVINKFRVSYYLTAGIPTASYQGIEKYAQNFVPSDNCKMEGRAGYLKGAPNNTCDYKLEGDAGARAPHDTDDPTKPHSCAMCVGFGQNGTIGTVITNNDFKYKCEGSGKHYTGQNPRDCYQFASWVQLH